MPFSKTVVISCAGVGSRLGLGQTKALLPLQGRPLLHWHLDMLADVEDVRVVVGFQASEVIKAALEVRKNTTFVFNHDYFHTKTAASVSLACRYAHESVFVLDGDMIIHPDDMARCLAQEEPFVGVAVPSSQECVYVQTMRGYVESFSRQSGMFEWIGPALLPRDIFSCVSDKHVYEVIEKILPLPYIEVRAMDIDTLQDYEGAQVLFKGWSCEC